MSDNIYKDRLTRVLSIVNDYRLLGDDFDINQAMRSIIECVDPWPEENK